MVLALIALMTFVNIKLAVRSNHVLDVRRKTAEDPSLFGHVPQFRLEQANTMKDLVNPFNWTFKAAFPELHAELKRRGTQ